MLPDFHGKIKISREIISAKIAKNAYMKQTSFHLVHVIIIQVVRSLLITCTLHMKLFPWTSTHLWCNTFCDEDGDDSLFV